MPTPLWPMTAASKRGSRDLGAGGSSTAVRLRVTARLLDISIGACLEVAFSFLDLELWSSFASRASRSLVRISSTVFVGSASVDLDLRLFLLIEDCALASAPKEISARLALKSSPVSDASEAVSEADTSEPASSSSWSSLSVCCGVSCAFVVFCGCCTSDWMEPLDSASEPAWESSEGDASEISSSSGRARTRRLSISEIAILLCGW